MILSGGGTAGHIYPALALADKLRDAGNEILFVGTAQGLEARLVPEAGYAFVSVPSGGFDRSRPWTLVTSGAKAASSILKARRIIRDFKADAVIGFGGYVSIPMGMAASAEKVPLVIHEQNSIAGMSNKFLAKRASLVCVTYPQTVEQLAPLTRVPPVLTGNPVRAEILEQTRDKARLSLGLHEDDISLFVFGGSRGARHINTALTRALPQLLAHDHLFITHATGSGEFETVMAETSEARSTKRYEPIAYCNDMGTRMAGADIIVMRAGATSLAELTALGVASILVPYPYATDDHQTHNAQALVEGGAALMVSDDQLDGDMLLQKLEELINNPGKRILMAQKCREAGRPAAAAMLVDSIYSVTERTSS